MHRRKPDALNVKIHALKKHLFRVWSLIMHVCEKFFLTPAIIRLFEYEFVEAWVLFWMAPSVEYFKYNG